MRTRVLSLVVFLLTVACAPQAAPTEAAAPPPDLVATLVQATLTVVEGGATAAPTTAATPAPSATASPAASPTVTPTYSPPKLYFTGATNCRSGPDTAYPVLVVLAEASQADIIGRYGENYWQVRLADGTICWVAGDAAQAEGSVHLAPTVEPPPTPTPQPPRRPVGLRYFYTCQLDGTVTVELSWQDAAENETGYRIYRDGILLVELPANAQAYTDLLPAAGSYRYEFAAFNGGGEATTGMTADISCR